MERTPSRCLVVMERTPSRCLVVLLIQLAVCNSCGSSIVNIILWFQSFFLTHRYLLQDISHETKRTENSWNIFTIFSTVVSVTMYILVTWRPQTVVTPREKSPRPGYPSWTSAEVSLVTCNLSIVNGIVLIHSKAWRVHIIWHWSILVAI